MATMRRARWHPPPPPTPRILNIPRRIRRKPTKQLTGGRSSSRGKLESLFDQERVFSRTVPIVLLNNNGEFARRERVEDVESYNRDSHNRREEADSDEEKWRFQAEFLRSECNFLRMERDIALKKLELNRVQTKRTLRSAVETLVSGKEKMHKGNRISSVLEEEIDDLEEKLKELHRNSGVRDFEFGKCSNFDKQACVLQRRLEKLGEGLLSEEKCVKEIRQMAETSLMIKTTRKVDQSFNSDSVNRFKDVESLRRKMEKLSKGMLEKMEEEYSSLLSISSSSASASASGSSATSSASASRRIEFPLLSSSAAHVQSFLHHKEKKLNEDKTCSGRCKKIVRKIVEQVKAEMEQWTQMQDMLERVRQEMEELQTSRDFWQDRALDSDDQLHSLHSSVQEWELKARNSETKVAELEKQINELHLKLEKLKEEKKKECRRIPRDSQRENEKHVLICRLKENHQRSSNCEKKKECENDQWRKQQCNGGGSRSSNVVAKRLPLQDIGNFSPLWEKRISLPFAMP